MEKYTQRFDALVLALSVVCLTGCLKEKEVVEPLHKGDIVESTDYDGYVGKILHVDCESVWTKAHEECRYMVRWVVPAYFEEFQTRDQLKPRDFNYDGQGADTVRKGSGNRFEPGQLSGGSVSNFIADVGL